MLWFGAREELPSVLGKGRVSHYSLAGPASSHTHKYLGRGLKEIITSGTNKGESIRRRGGLRIGIFPNSAFRETKKKFLKR